MSILSLLIILIVIGFAFWANNSYVSPGILRTIINIILILVTLGVVFSLVGWMPLLNHKV